MKLKRVVVTGLGSITPLGSTAPETWAAMLRGESGAGPVTLFDASTFKTRFACEVKGFNPLDHFDRKEARKYDRYSMFAIVAANEAIADSGILNYDKLDRDEIGVIISAGIGGLKTLEDELYAFDRNRQLGPKFSPFFIPKMIADIASGHVSMLNGFRCPNFAPAAACASSTNAIIDSFNYIRLGIATAMVAGGSEAPITESAVGGFNSMQALSTRNDEFMTASRPFSKSRDGFVMGEGSACLILEEMEHALARGAKIYAELVGGGMSADAYHLTASHPEGLGAILVMNRALKDAHLMPQEIDYINVHGTSTPVGDLSELKAIKEVFGEHAKDLNISSTKSMSGHLLGATGALEVMACVLAVQNDIVPPTINFTPGDEDEEIDYSLNFTFNKAQKRTVNAALSNTFGFGGHNASAIVRKFNK